MGWLDRLLGHEENAPQQSQQGFRRQSEVRQVAAPPPAEGGPMTDEQALERYRYMVRTAPPEAIEQAHAEAFARLTPEQRQQVLAQLAQAAPPNERAAAQATSPEDPRAMGRLATRAEMRQPGIMERMLGPGGGGGGGLGLGGSLLGSFAMGFAGSMVANSLFGGLGGFGGHGEAANAADTAETPEDTGQIADDFQETGGAEPEALADPDTGDADWGGGDWGGGDFGGGDFDI